jgi:hypothetical protein
VQQGLLAEGTASGKSMEVWLLIFERPSGGGGGTVVCMRNKIPKSFCKD